MDGRQVDDLLLQQAPTDVVRTVQWLLSRGYRQTHRAGDNTFGARWVYSGRAQVLIAVDRSQWVLDVASEPGGQPWQYDLVLAAMSGLTYGHRFPGTGSFHAGTPLPSQLPAGLSWHETLPEALTWITNTSREADLFRAQSERFELMWRLPARTRQRPPSGSSQA